MAYYGAPSRGCERCRQRKVKCDQRRPTCLKCGKLGLPCPGYRNLVDVLFRDDSGRFTRNSRGLPVRTGPEPGSSTSSAPAQSRTTPYSPRDDPSQPLFQPVNEYGSNFFFSSYSYDGPHSTNFDAWFAATVMRDDAPARALKTVIEAIGMAAISNVQYAPGVAAKARVKYGQALMATNKALRHQTDAFSDTILVVVLLLGLYEFVSFDGLSGFNGWNTHVQGVATLFRHRGEKQFDTAFGRDTFEQFRWKCMYGCVQQDIEPPEALHETDEKFNAKLGREGLNEKNRPRPVGELCFRILKVQAAIRRGQMTDVKAIYDEATAMDCEAKLWESSLPQDWSYTTVDDTVSPGSCFQGKRHIYRSFWTAEDWNNWRCIRILLNRMALRHGAPGDAAACIATIQQLSTDICISSACFRRPPHISTLLWPLTVVANEPLSSHETRRWAVKELRRISSSMGYRQARLMADHVSQTIANNSMAGT